MISDLCSCLSDGYEFGLDRKLHGYCGVPLHDLWAGYLSFEAQS